MKRNGKAKWIAFAVVLTALCLIAGSAMAENFTVNANGIEWTCTTLDNINTVSIEPKDKESISGDVVIPSTVTNSGTQYSVTSIGQWAFAD